VPLKAKKSRSGVYAISGGGYNARARSPAMTLFHRYSAVPGLFLTAALFALSPVQAEDRPASGDDLEIEVTKRGLGKQVVMTQGTREWFMLIDVTPENSVVVRQEKDREQYLVDDTETHDRPMTQAEVDAAIADYVNSVKTRIQKR
jgi:hypothetical protein